MNDMKWKSYEEVATYLLNQFADEFGLSHVEPSHIVEGQRSKTRWKIDAKGFLLGGEGFLIVECRHYTTSRQNQEKIGALAYRILDAGANGGIIVSPLGLQSGAEKIALAENILNIELDEDSTPHEFGMRFLNKLFIGFRDQVIASSYVGIEAVRTCSNCGRRFVTDSKQRICSICLTHT
jgi:hypothetical protein